MRAVLMTAVGGPDVLKLEEVPEPEIAGETGASLPAVLGCDAAGVVEGAGPAVSRVRPGDEVYFCDGASSPRPAPTRK
jgi:NADPH:quinone reductase